MNTTRQGLSCPRIRIIFVCLCVLLFCCIREPAPVLAATKPGTSVYLNQGNDLFYGDGGRTRYFTVNGRVAYCAQPSKYAPPSGSYTTSALKTYPNEYGYQNSLEVLRGVLYYGYGGPGFDKNMWPKTKWNGQPLTDADYQAYTHILAADRAFADAPHALLMTSSTFKDWASRELLGYRYDDSTDVLNPQAVGLKMNALALSGAVPKRFNAYEIHTGSTTQVIVTFDPPGSLRIKKSSGNTDVTGGNSLYALKNASYGIFSDAAATKREGTLSTDAAGASSSTKLFEGDYWVKEERAPQGYARDSTVHKVSIPLGKTIELKLSDTPKINPLEIVARKLDKETGTAVPQGAARLADAQFTIRFYAGHYKTLESLPRTPTRSWVVKTDTDGIARLDAAHKVSGDAFFLASDTTPGLPLGTVTIEETKAPPGYLINKDISLQLISEETSDRERLDRYHVPTYPEQIIRGGIKVQKRDLQTDGTTPQGAATLEGAEISIKNVSDHAVMVDGARYEPGQIVQRIYTAKDGSAQTANDALPYGTYELTETKAPNGYLLNTGWKKTIEIRKNGHVYDVTKPAGKVEAGRDDDSSVPDRVKRGDFSFSKTAFPDQGRLARVAFLVTSATTKEQHVIVTDENGTWSSAVSHNPHITYRDDSGVTHETNGNDHLVDDDGTSITESDRLDPKAGIWFFGSVTDREALPDNRYGALPFDTYTVQELRCAGNEGLQLVRFTVQISRDNAVVELGTVLDSAASLESELTGTNKKHELKPAKQTKVTDRVSYKGLIPRHRYTITMKLWDSTTGAFVKADGQELAVTQEFTPTRADGRITQRAQLDSRDLAGHTVVAFEYLYDEGGTLVAEHADEHDERQAICFPRIETSASANDGGREVPAQERVEVHDTVFYQGLIPGNEYHVSGTLHLRGIDGADAGPLKDANGNEVTASKTFTAPANSGSVTLTFTVDTRLLQGREIVAFETLERDKRELAVHTDINDAGQTVHVPAISTEAGGPDGEKVVPAAPEVVVTDTISYRGLTPGLTYQLRGSLHTYEEEGKAKAVTDSDGKPVEAHTSFTPTEPSGQVTTSFTLDTTMLGGSPLVVFEELMRDGITYATHQDIADEQQTVHVARIATSATGPDGSHDVPAAEKVTLTDRVVYENLSTGHAYTLTGTVMDRASGEAVLINGAPITATKTFTPEKPDGVVEVTFELDTRELAGRDLVVFETLSVGDTTWATHADLADDHQTVRIPDIRTTLTGDEGARDIEPTGEITLTDTVAYRGLTPGRTYMLTGTLHRKNDDGTDGGEATDSSGTPITATTEFTAEASEGIVEVTFTFQADHLAGTRLVAFEQLNADDVIFATHADIEDTGQTITLREQKPEKESPVAKLAQTGRDGIVKVALALLGCSALAGIGAVATMRWRRGR